MQPPYAITPEFSEFSRLAREYRRVPVVATLIADDLTPVSAFARLAPDAPRAFLFESVVGGEKTARYSFLGADPPRGIAVRGGIATARDYLRGSTHTTAGDDPLALIQRMVEAGAAPPLAGLPRFLGGAVGYAAYDAIRYYEHLPNSPRDDRELPDVLFDEYTSMVIFDHVRKTMLVVSHADTPADADERALRAAYAAARGEIEGLIAKLETPVSLPRLRAPAGRSTARPQYTSNFTQAAFETAVAASQEYIKAGDIFQVVLSQRLLVETRAAPFDIYRALRYVNPSPFMFLLKTPEVTLVGASPEIMCRVDGGLITNRPLAGTRPRGASDTEDARLRDELLADPKERAEHIMLVDLARNDVGRVATPGSVKLGSVMNVEFYSHVMHICSDVTGRLAPGRTAFDALRAALPVGTVSGAPKVRAMEIIDELEPTRRGPYAGAVGYVDFAGNMDTCIALRTLVMQPAADGGFHAYAQAGAGVVADSVPRSEYEETLNKAAGLLSAIALAENSRA